MSRMQLEAGEDTNGTFDGRDTASVELQERCKQWMIGQRRLVCRSWVFVECSF